jgi:hypothetical protein
MWRETQKELLEDLSRRHNTEAEASTAFSIAAEDGWIITNRQRL